MSAEIPPDPIVEEIGVAVEQARLLAAMRGIVSDEHLADYGRALLDRHLGIASLAPSRPPHAPLSAHQFLLDKGVASFEADWLTAQFSKAAAEVSLTLTGKRLERHNTLNSLYPHWGYEFTESDRAAMEIAWNALDPKPLSYRSPAQSEVGIQPPSPTSS